MNTLKPEVGSQLTLRFKHPHMGGVGTKVSVLRSRKDRRCASGLRIWVTAGTKFNYDLDARWFKEYYIDFSFALQHD